MGKAMGKNSSAPHLCCVASLRLPVKPWHDHSMNRKTFSMVAGIIFTLVALFHLIRIFEDLSSPPTIQ
jgi:sensor c-di-GMP phosphodiesterase-like protein